MSFRSITILLFVLGSSTSAFSQNQILKDSIPDKDTFNISIPINKELADYFTDPLGKSLLSYFNQGVVDCIGNVSKKPYWYSDQQHSIYRVLAHCTNDKTPTLFCAGNKVGELGGSGDTLIEFSSLYSEKSLSKNDFVNKQTKDLTKRFGSTYIKKNGYIIYSDYKNSLLVLFTTGKKVTFFRYVRMNKSVTCFKDIDKGILKTK